MKIVIKGRLPGLNEYIEAERRNKYIAAKLKHNAENLIIMQVKRQVRGFRPEYPLVMHYHWYEDSKRRDKSNVCAYGRKVIEDALIKAGIIAGDGWKYIDGFTDEFSVDKTNPRIEVTIECKGAERITPRQRTSISADGRA